MWDETPRLFRCYICGNHFWARIEEWRDSNPPNGFKYAKPDHVCNYCGEDCCDLEQIPCEA